MNELPFTYIDGSTFSKPIGKSSFNRHISRSNCKDGHLLKIIELTRYLPTTSKTVIQRNCCFGHSENVILAILTDFHLHILELSARLIFKSRSASKLWIKRQLLDAIKLQEKASSKPRYTLEKQRQNLTVKRIWLYIKPLTLMFLFKYFCCNNSLKCYFISLIKHNDYPPKIFFINIVDYCDFLCNTVRLLTTYFWVIDHHMKPVAEDLFRLLSNFHYLFTLIWLRILTLLAGLNFFSTLIHKCTLFLNFIFEKFKI